MKSKDDDREPEVLNCKPHKKSQPPAKHIIAFRQIGISVLSNMSKNEQTLFVNWAQEVVDQYGILLQKNPAKIKNIVDLPCPKEDLKIAIKALMPVYVTKGSDDLVGLLKDRYVRLSEFQEIRQEDIDIIVGESAKSDQRPEWTDASVFSTYQQYMQVVISEQNILLDDINTFISDL